MEIKDNIYLENISIEENGVITDKLFIKLMKKIGINNLKEFFEDYSEKIDPYARDVYMCETIQKYTGMYELLRYKYLNGKLDDSYIFMKSYIGEEDGSMYIGSGFRNRYKLLGFHWFEIEYMAKFFLNKESTLAEEAFNIDLTYFEGTPEQKQEFQAKLDLFKKYVREVLKTDDKPKEKPIQKCKIIPFVKKK